MRRGGAGKGGKGGEGGVKLSSATFSKLEAKAGHCRGGEGEGGRQWAVPAGLLVCEEWHKLSARIATATLSCLLKNTGAAGGWAATHPGAAHTGRVHDSVCVLKGDRSSDSVACVWWHELRECNSHQAGCAKRR